jgi:hypothetical protein
VTTRVASNCIFHFSLASPPFGISWGVSQHTSTIWPKLFYIHVKCQEDK